MRNLLRVCVGKERIDPGVLDDGCVNVIGY